MNNSTERESREVPQNVGAVVYDPAGRSSYVVRIDPGGDYGRKLVYAWRTVNGAVSDGFVAKLLKRPEVTILTEGYAFPHTTHRDNEMSKLLDDVDSLKGCVEAAYYDGAVSEQESEYLKIFIKDHVEAFLYEVSLANVTDNGRRLIAKFNRPLDAMRYAKQLSIENPYRIVYFTDHDLNEETDVLNGMELA